MGGCRTKRSLLLDQPLQDPIDGFTSHLASKHEQDLGLPRAPYQSGIGDTQCLWHKGQPSTRVREGVVWILAAAIRMGAVSPACDEPHSHNARGSRTRKPMVDRPCLHDRTIGSVQIIQMVQMIYRQGCGGQHEGGVVTLSQYSTVHARVQWLTGLGRVRCMLYRLTVQ